MENNIVMNGDEMTQDEVVEETPVEVSTEDENLTEETPVKEETTEEISENTENTELTQ